MDIAVFFQQSVGKWVSQRTSHYLSQNQSENAKSDLIVEVLPSSDVVQLCQPQGIEPAQASGIKLSWNGFVDRNPKTQIGTSFLVILPDHDMANRGQLLRHTGGKTMLGRYELGDDEVLTLTAEAGSLYAEERIWFANPNFRLRTSIVKRNGNCNVASFCSEIRIGIPAPAKSEATETAS